MSVATFGWGMTAMAFFLFSLFLLFWENYNTWHTNKLWEQMLVEWAALLQGDHDNFLLGVFVRVGTAAINVALVFNFCDTLPQTMHVGKLLAYMVFFGSLSLAFIGMVFKAVNALRQIRDI